MESDLVKVGRCRRCKADFVTKYCVVPATCCDDCPHDFDTCHGDCYEYNVRRSCDGCPFEVLVTQVVE